MNSNITFRQLDLNMDLPNPEWALEIWYDEARDIPLCDLSLQDLARTIRQQIYLDTVVPVAIRRLMENPWAGGLYDGELILSCNSIPSQFWQAHSNLLNSIKVVFTQFNKKITTFDQEQALLEPECRELSIQENVLEQVLRLQGKIARL